MKGLLSRTLLYYLILSSAILILSGPGFYLLMEKLYLVDVDEAILLRRDEFLKNKGPFLKITDISTWNRFNRDTRILADTISKVKDEIIQEIFYDEMVPEWEPYRVLYKRIQIQKQPYVLMIRLNLVESQDLIITLTWLYLGVLMVLLLLIFFLTKIISNKLWHPFYETLKKIEKFNIEQKSAPILSASNIAEFNQLNAALDKLIGDNMKAYQIQKEFTENASHELQTPLAIFQSKLDMLLQQPSLTIEQGEIIQSLYEASGRLSRVNKNLLLLAKIENKQFYEIEAIDIVGLVNDVLPYFAEQCLANNLQISFNVRTKQLIVAANKGLCEIMINNLILNSVSHNLPNCSITIVIENNRLSVSNPGLKRLDMETLFKRFSKVSPNAHRTGLGLAIAEQVCLLHNWRISYSFEKNTHTFLVVF